MQSSEQLLSPAASEDRGELLPVLELSSGLPVPLSSSEFAFFIRLLAFANHVETYMWCVYRTQSCILQCCYMHESMAFTVPYCACLKYAVK